MASGVQGRSRLSPQSNQLQPTTPPYPFHTVSSTAKNTKRPAKAIVSWLRRNGSRTPRAIFDVENGECVEKSQITQTMPSNLQTLKEPILNGGRGCSGRDRKRVAARRLIDNEVELSPGSSMSQQQVVKKMKTCQEKPKSRAVKNEAVKDKNTDNKIVLQRAISRQVVLTSGPSSSTPMIPLERLRFHASELSISVKNASALPPEPTLPTVYSSKHPDLNVITPETVAEILRGDYQEQLMQYKLLDCRFSYEFQGGSLTGASLSCDPEKMEMQLFMSAAIERRTRTALVFFCEYSANRAPKMLRHVRNLDRKLHAHCYPALYYPELYLIDGGYRNCFKTHQHEICTPLAMHVAMEDERFAEACRHECATWRRRWKPHKTVANCAAKLNMQLQVDRHSCDQVRPTATGVRSLLDEL